MNLELWFKTIDRAMPADIKMFGFKKVRTPLALIEYPDLQCATVLPSKMNALENCVKIIAVRPCIIRGVLIPWQETIYWLKDQVFAPPGYKLKVHFNKGALS